MHCARSSRAAIIRCLQGEKQVSSLAQMHSINPSIYLSLGPTDNDTLTNMVSYLTSNCNPPSAVSVSCGPENIYSGSYLDRVCNEFMKTGSRGISVVFSSGNHCVGGNGSTKYSHDIYALWLPWITSVGGNQFTNNVETTPKERLL